MLKFNAKSKYNRKDDFNMEIYSLIKNKSIVLDVGCGYGQIGKELIKNKEATVYGVDIDDKSVEYCIKNRGYKKCIKTDLNYKKDFAGLIFDEKFDYIIFADVLEHLIDPDEVLNFFQKNLKPEGKIIISLPNIAFVLYRIKLLFGFFDYEKHGVIYEGHLRFFSLNNYKQILPSLKNYTIQIKGYSSVSKKFFILKYLAKIFPNLFALQFIIIAQKDAK